MPKISKIRDAVAWDATGLDSAKREMVPEDQRLLADGGVALSSFRKLTEDDVRSLVMASAKTYCALDPMLTPLVVDC